MSKPRVFITRRIPERGLQPILEACEADVWQEELPPDQATLLQKVRGVEGLLCLLTDTVDGELMDAAGPQLKVISNHAVGYDNIDVPAATQRGIPVGNTPGILTDATADFTMALLLAAARRVVEADQYVRAGKWQTWGPSLLLGADFAGATLGIIGFGRIGQAVARRAAGFGLRILFSDPHEPLQAMQATGAQRVSLEVLLAEADFVSVHTPLTEETYHLIGPEALARMKPEAVLVNTSRGPVVDPQALYTALKTHQIGAAALDVSEPEPLPPGSPLLELDNLILAPHIASASRTTRGNMAWMAAQNLLAGLQGECLPNCVNPEVYGE
jgi:glyoxylate reductase